MSLTSQGASKWDPPNVVFKMFHVSYTNMERPLLDHSATTVEPFQGQWAWGSVQEF